MAERNVIINYDAFAFCMPHLEGDVLIDSMLAAADLKNSPITSIFWNWGEGNFAPYPSKVLEPCDFGRFPGWAKKGFDIVGECHKATKERGLESFFSYRINGSDTDKFENGQHIPQMPKFKKANPDLLIYDEWSQRGLSTPKYDFSHIEVRAHKIAILEEVLDLYDYDGIEIDFARACPVLPPRRQWELREHVTEFMAGVRAMTEKKAAKRKRPILVGARVAPTQFGCQCDGLDIKEWVNQGLVNIFILGSRSYEVDYRFFQNIVQHAPIGNGIIHCYPCIDEIHSTDGYRNPPLEVFRGVVTNWRHQGFTGFQTFNWQTNDPMLPAIDEKTDDWLDSQWRLHKRVYEEIGRGIDGLDKTFVIQRRLGGHFRNFQSLPWNWKTPRQSWINSNIEAQLPAKLHADEDQDVFLTLYVGMPPVARMNAVLTILLSENEEIHVRVNGGFYPVPEKITKNWYYYYLSAMDLAEGENLIQISLKHSIRECNTWVEKVELEVRSSI